MDPPSLNLEAIFRGLKRENPVSLSTDEVAQLRHVTLFIFSADWLRAARSTPCATSVMHEHTDLIAQ